jgi:hypothetical protein
LFFGAIFILFVLFAPQGIWGLATRAWTGASPEAKGRRWRFLSSTG